MEGQCKEKEGVWTTQNIRQECNYWTLEADAELLKHLQQFSQKLLLETHTALKSLDVLESQLNTTYVKFSTVSNSFLALSDTQFIENRVYEDEETSNLAVPSKIPEDTSNKNEDTVIIEKLKKAINNGFKVLNDKFETIKVPESDSEDDEDDSSVKSGLLLKPVNPYEDLVLPYLIGSAEFNSDDTVGLEDVASENENEEVLSESDQISESEDSEPESDQTKVQTIEVVDQDDIFRYKQVSLAEEALRIRDSSHENQLNSRGQNFFGTLPDNTNNWRTSSEIKASVVKDITSCDQSVTSSASSNEFVDRGIHDIDQDEAGQSFNDTDETDNLFQAPPTFKPQKIPAGGVSVLRPGVQLPPAKSTLQQTSSITDKEKQKPKHNHLTRNNTDYGSLSEDDPQSTSIFKGKTISKNEISYCDNDDDDDDDNNLFRKTDDIDEIRSTKNEKSTISSSEIFSDLRSNKLSKFHSVSNNEFKKSFWLDSEKDLIDNSDNFFDSKLIFSDDDDDDDFLFSSNEQTNFMNKKDTIVSGKSKSTNVINSQSDNQVRIGEPSIFTENDMLFSDKSSSSANFFNVVTDTGRMPNIDKLSKNVTNGEEKKFNYLFDDFTDEEDLFKDILPTKNDISSERHKAQNELITPIDNPNLNTEKKPLPNIDNFENNEGLFKVIPTTENVTATKQIKPINTPNLNTEKKALPNIDDFDNNEDLFNDILPSKNVTSSKQTEQVKPITNLNLKIERKPLPNIVDFKDTEDLFSDSTSSNHSLFTGSSLEDDFHKKGGHLFDDFGSDEDLFSFSTNSVDSINSPVSIKLAQEIKPPKKGLFDNQELSPSHNDGKNVLGSTSESNTIFKHITNNNLQPQQLIKRDQTIEDSVTSPDDSISNNTVLPIQFTSSSIFNTISVENEKKSKSFTSDEPTQQERTQIKSMINKIEHPKTLSVGQSTVKSEVIISSHETSDGAVFTSSLRPSPGKLSADLLLNIDPTTLLPGSRPTFTEREELLPSDTVSTLQSVIKERPKIQVKRRPPSRKARQEAIRISKLEEEEDYTSKSDLINSNLEPSFISSTDGDNLGLNSNQGIDKITPHSLKIFDTPTELSSNLLDNEPSLVNENSTRSEGGVLKTPQADHNMVKVEENKLLKHTNIRVEEDLNELVVKSGNIIFDGESDDDLFGEISTKQKNVYLSRSESDNDWLSSGATETEDFLFPQSMTNVSSSQSTKIKSSLVEPTLLKQDKSVTTTIPKDIFGEESLNSTNKEPKIRQIPKTNFLFDDEDGDLDIFSQSTNVTSSQVQIGRTSELGTLTKVSGHSTQKVKLSSQQVFTDPLMSIKNVD